VNRLSIHRGLPLGLALALVLGLALNACGPSQRPFVLGTADPIGPQTAFEESPDGWAVVQLPVEVTPGGAHSRPAVQRSPAEWQPEGGKHGDGHVRATGTSSTASVFFEAPADFLGDQAAFIGGELTFALRAEGDEVSGRGYLLLVGSNGRVLVRQLDPPGEDWTSYSITLQHHEFVDGESSNRPEPRDFANILRELEAIRISADWGRGSEALTALDEVALRR
jgi:hypothetical protein